MVCCTNDLSNDLSFFSILLVQSIICSILELRLRNPLIKEEKPNQMRIRYVLSFCAILFISKLGLSQCLNYSYDANGNRIKRAILQCKRGPEIEASTFDDSSPLVNIFPNPGSSIVTLECDSSIFLADMAEIAIHSIEGKVVESFNLKKEVPFRTIDVSVLPSGVYFLRISGFKSLENWKSKQSFVVIR